MKLLPPGQSPPLWPLTGPRCRRTAYWRARTLRTQLLILFILIEVIAAVVAGAVSIFNARTATQVEIAASMELAELLGEEAVMLTQQETPAERFLADLSSQLRLVAMCASG